MISWEIYLYWSYTPAGCSQKYRQSTSPPFLAISSGGVYSEGPGKANDFVAPYLKAFLGFLGMTDLTVFRAEGLKVPGVKELAMERAIESIKID
jgi:FMN-dependent NADH-azoreductase